MLVKVFVKTDLVTDLGGIEIDPCLIHMGFDFGQKVTMGRLFERYAFAIAQVGAGFVGDLLAFFAGSEVAKIHQLRFILLE